MYKVLTVLCFCSALVTALLPTSARADDIPLEQRLTVCNSCHGVDGVPTGAEIPIIAGQEYYYLYVQLKDYAAGRRANPIMTGMVEGLSKDDMKALAEHFSTMPWPNIDSSPEQALVDAGESGLSAGQCSQCHSTYQGDSRIPRLAGQQLVYLEQTMLDYKNRVRLNLPAKGSLLASFDAEKIKAMSHRLAGM